MQMTYSFIWSACSDEPENLGHDGHHDVSFHKVVAAVSD